MPGRAGAFDQGGRRGVLRPHLDRRPRHHRGAHPDRLRRRRVPQPERPHRRADQRAAPTQRRPHLHGPVRRRPRARVPSTSPRGTTRSCSVPATAASRPRRTGRSCSAPSTTRWSPARAVGCPDGTSTRRAETVERRRDRRPASPQAPGSLAGRGRRALRGRRARRDHGRALADAPGHRRRPPRATRTSNSSTPTAAAS